MKTITKIGNGFDLYNPFDKIKIIINEPGEEPYERKEYLGAIGDCYAQNTGPIPENIFKAAIFRINNHDEFVLLLDENNNPTNVKLFYYGD